MGRRGAVVAMALALSVASVAAAASPTGTGPVATGDRPAVRVAGPSRRVTVVASGDVLTESRVRTVAAGYGASTGARFDFAPMFEPVRPLIEGADVAICHMELPIGTAGSGYGNYGRSPYGGNLLLAPYEIATGVRAVGFDRCSTASNHSDDLGANGIAWTLAALAEHGLGASGTATSAATAGTAHFTAGGIRMAHVSFTAGSNTGAPSEPWRLNLSRNPAVVAEQVARARREGAEIVLVSMHLTQEMLTAPTAADRALVTSIVRAAKVDALFVHGPHVVQPFEFVDGTPVWWSLGNFVSEMGGPTATGRYVDPRTGDGLLARVSFLDMGEGLFKVDVTTIAICNESAARTVRPASIDLARPDVAPAVKAELAACLARTRTVVPDAA
ncbi:MAG: CapA family protein [Ilumatobacteraceae bacterium]